MEAREIRGAIFDADGTLLDSMCIWDTIGERYLRSLGHAPREDLSAVFKNMSLEKAALHYQRVYGVTRSVEELVDGVTSMLMRFYATQAQLKPGVKELLSLLQAHDVPMCVATATDRELVEAALRRSGVLPWFQKIYTCSEIGCEKTEPEIYQAAARFLGTDAAHTLVFEDALYAVRTAAAAGFAVVAVRDEYEPQQSELQKLAGVYLEDLRDVRGLEDLLPAKTGGK